MSGAAAAGWGRGRLGAAEASGPGPGPGPVPAAWQCVERDLRSQMGSERGLVEEYVEKMPNPSLKGAGDGGTAPARPARDCARRAGAALPLPPESLLSPLQRLNPSTWVI